MITWLQTAFGKHHKWILTAILGLIGVSFVFTIGAVPRGQAAGQSAAPKMFLGVNLNDPQQMESLQMATAMSLAWQNHQARSNEEMTQALLGRIAVLYLADQWQLPLPTDEQKKAYIQTLAFFKNDAGEFDASKYQSFVDGLQTQPQERRDMIAETLAQNWRLQQVIMTLSGPGYALPYSAEIQAALRDTSWNLNVATLDFDKFMPNVEVTDAVLQNLFNHDPTRFQVPAAVQLSYVHFTAPPSTATPTAADLKDFIAANPKAFPNVETPDNLDAKTTAAATAAWRQAQGDEEAGTQASNFAQALYALKVTQGTPQFDALLQKFNVKLEPLPPVVADKPAPAGSPVPDEILQKAAQELSAQNYFSEPLRVPDGAAVLFYEGATTTHMPTFEEARADVAAAYKDEQKTKLFEAKGNELQTALTQAVAAGKSFTDAATALGLTVKNFPALTFSDPPEDMDYELLAALANPNAAGVPLILALKPGEVSPMLPTADVGAFVDVVKRDTPALTADSPATQTTLKEMGAQEGEASADAILAPIVQRAMQALQNGG
ncbi:MAG: hypothetical protein ABSH19_00730 [Opitutales bacterium]|jgi:hypothetical protein